MTQSTNDSCDSDVNAKYKRYTAKVVKFLLFFFHMLLLGCHSLSQKGIRIMRIILNEVKQNFINETETCQAPQTKFEKTRIPLNALFDIVIFEFEIRTFSLMDFVYDHDVEKLKSKKTQTYVEQEKSD